MLYMYRHTIDQLSDAGTYAIINYVIALVKRNVHYRECLFNKICP